MIAIMYKVQNIPVKGCESKVRNKARDGGMEGERGREGRGRWRGIKGRERERGGGEREGKIGR